MHKKFSLNDPIWKYFYAISAIPRVSKNERQVIQYIKNVFVRHQIMTEIDEAGNLMAKIQPSKGFEKEPIIILQAHADMVAVKSATSNHNFDNNPIVPLYKNGYLYAKETNLGADNASGVAIIMALATDKSYRHGPLEIIITTQEEIGLIGAKNINSNFIRGQYLINFDSSNKNITIGCNGAVQIDAKLKLKKIQIPSHKVIMSIKLFDLLGGHSAQQAKFNHLNAFKGMGYILFNLKSCFDLNLINFLSSSIEMQIPTSCCAFIAIDKRDVLKIKAKINIIYKQLKEIYRVENHIQLSVNMVKKTDAQMIATSDSMAIINLIYTLPDGQQTFNILYQKTECSSNIESIYLTNQNCRIAIKCRALFESQKFQLCNQIAQIIKSSNGEVDISNNTKGWPIETKDNNFGLAFQKFLKNEFKKILSFTFSSGGLEPAVLIDKIPTIVGAFSYGAENLNPHSISEKLNVASVYDVISEMKNFLAHIKKYKKFK